MENTKTYRSVTPNNKALEAAIPAVTHEGRATVTRKTTIITHKEVPYSVDQLKAMSQPELDLVLMAFGMDKGCFNQTQYTFEEVTGGSDSI